MPYSISTLLIRNLGDVFGENDPARRRAAIDEIYTEDCVFYDPSKGVYHGRDESTASRARSKLLTLNSDISQLPSPRNRAMAGWSAGIRPPG
ncbi:MAG TPA: nuclear transport factor 2 family protein [Candidatus Acidoferrum sp.]